MSNLAENSHPAKVQTVEASFFRRLWQGILRIDEALSYDPDIELERRLIALEKQIKASHPATPPKR